jgi:hypothetical protein
LEEHFLPLNDENVLKLELNVSELENRVPSPQMIHIYTLLRHCDTDVDKGCKPAIRNVQTIYGQHYNSVQPEEKHFYHQKSIVRSCPNKMSFRIARVGRLKVISLPCHCSFDSLLTLRAAEREEERSPKYDIRRRARGKP